MAAPASAVHELGSLQLSDQLPQSPRHGRTTLFILEVVATRLPGQGTTYPNDLTDATLDPVYPSICGYPGQHLDTVFAPELKLRPDGPPPMVRAAAVRKCRVEHV